MNRPLGFVALAAILVVMYLGTLVYVIAYVAIQPTPEWWRNAFAVRRSSDLAWLFLFRAASIVLASLPFAVVIARVYRRLAVRVALALTIIVWLTIDASSVIQSFKGAADYVRGFVIADSVELLCALPLLVWFLQRLPSNNRVERAREP